MNFWHTLADLLLPRHCVVCGAELDSTEKDLCNVCLCRMVPVTWPSATDNPLLRIMWDRHEVDAAGSSFYYNASSDCHNIFIAIKYHGSPKLGERLARLSFPTWHAMGLGQEADYVIPVPLSLRRRLKRGYNQTEWIAKGVAASIGIPLCTDVLIRRKNNDTQTHKTAQQRQENTYNIFEARRGAHRLERADCTACGRYHDHGSNYQRQYKSIAQNLSFSAGADIYAGMGRRKVKTER